MRHKQTKRQIDTDKGKNSETYINSDKQKQRQAGMKRERERYTINQTRTGTFKKGRHTEAQTDKNRVIQTGREKE